MTWNDLYGRARGLARASRYVNIAAAAMFIWTMVVTVEVIRELDALAAELPDNASGGILQYQALFNPRPDLLDYAVSISSATSTYAIVTVVLFMTASLLKALGLIAEVAVIDLDDEFGPDDDADHPDQDSAEPASP